jgi:predicted DNA-binding transcriptional regulator YafY
MYLNQVARCISLIYLLQTRLTRSTEGIAQELGVSKRTIYRDFRVLEEVGIPIRCDSVAGGHIIDHHFHLKATQLSDYELEALLLAAQISSSILNQEFSSIIDQAIWKLLSHLPNQTRDELTNLLKACTVDMPKQFSLNGSQDVYRTIIKAIRKRLRVRITYNTPEDSNLKQTCLAPYRLIASPDGWGVIGRSSLHREVLRFELQQIYHTELTEDAFYLPCRFQRCMPSLRTRVNNSHTLISNA